MITPPRTRTSARLRDRAAILAANPTPTPRKTDQGVQLVLGAYYR